MTEAETESRVKAGCFFLAGLPEVEVRHKEMVFVRHGTSAICLECINGIACFQLPRHLALGIPIIAAMDLLARKGNSRPRVHEVQPPTSAWTYPNTSADKR